MAYKPPKDIARAGIVTGSTKASLSWDKALVAGFLAGAYIAIAGLLAATVSAGLRPEIWGTLPTLFTGTVFALGLILVIVAGPELLTRNMALVPPAAMTGRTTLRKLAENWVFVLLGNLLGGLFVAYFPLGNVGGAVIFVAGAYWFVHSREVHEEPGDTPTGAPEREDDGRTAAPSAVTAESGR